MPKIVKFWRKQVNFDQIRTELVHKLEFKMTYQSNRVSELKAELRALVIEHRYAVTSRGRTLQAYLQGDIDRVRRELGKVEAAVGMA